MPRQQQQQYQWSRGSSHVFPPARQARQQQPLQQQPLQQPSRGIPTIGGDGEDGSGPLSVTFFGGDGGAVEERLQSENVEMPMFSLSEGPQQSAPTAVALAAAAPAAEAVTGTSVFPAVSSRVWWKRPRRQRARHRRQYLQFSPLHWWGGRPGCPLLQMKQRH